MVPTYPWIFDGLNGAQLRNPRVLASRCLPLAPPAGSMAAHPLECARYLVAVGSLGVKSYLEIGSFNGVSLVCLLEYLTARRRSRGLPPRPVTAECVDRTIRQPLRDYAATMPNVTIVETDRAGLREAYAGRRFDLVLVDGDHSYEACARDLDFAMDVADHVAVHDIRHPKCPGVARAWEETKARRPQRRFWEFHQAGGAGIGLTSAPRFKAPSIQSL